MLFAVRIRELPRNAEQRLRRVVEWAVPARGARPLQPHLAPIETEVPGYGERRGGEDPRARPAVELPAENLGHRKRSGMESQRVPEHLDPANEVGAALVAPALEQGTGFARPGRATRKALAPFVQHLESVAQGRERGIETGDGVGEFPSFSG